MSAQPDEQGRGIFDVERFRHGGDGGEEVSFAFAQANAPAKRSKHIHTLSLKRCPQAEVFAVASPTPGNAQKFAEKNDIPHYFTDYKKLLAMPDVDMIVAGVSNDGHCRNHAFPHCPYRQGGSL